MKVFLTGSLNADILARQLRYYKVEAHSGLPPFLGSSVFRDFDIVYSVCFMRSIGLTLSAKLLGKVLVVHFVGSDAFEFAYEKGLGKVMSNFILGACDQVLYVTDDLRRLVGHGKGEVVPIPIDTKMFRREEYDGEKRDVLYYCPDPKIYRADWIVKYAKSHPDETITVLGFSSSLNLPNIKVVPYVAYGQMPKVYHAHRCLIRMTTHDGYPKMPYEAVLCGLEVIWNGQRITTVPKEMLMEHTVPKLIAILESLK